MVIRNWLPRDDDDEVHDVPEVAHVAALVQDEAQRHDLRAHLDREDYHEDRLQVLLKCAGKRRPQLEMQRTLADR